MGIRALLTSALAAGLLLVVTSPAGAQERFGAKGSFAITGEELTGYHAEKRKYDNEDGYEYQTQRSGLALLVTTGGAKVGAHYFLLPQFSVGGIVGYDMRTGSNTIEDGDGTYTTDLAKEHTFVFAARAGYALMFTDWVGFWPRAGVTFHTLSVSDVFSENGLAFTLEANFVIVPTPNIGVLIGPTLDLDLFGSRDYKDAFSQGNTVDRRYRTIGLQVGMFFWI